MISQNHISNQLGNVERLGLLPVFRLAAIRHRVPVTLLLAIASRESGMGTDPFLHANDWTGRDGHGKGIMQVDDRYHSIMQQTPGDDHITNIEFATQFLAELMNRFDKKAHAVAAYNAGASGVQKAIGQGINPDW
jgi:soluble lytic murein transglycosylase-like protein